MNKIDSPLVDSYGRRIESVRISLTDRCNLRCRYCIEENDITWMDSSELLTFDELTRIIGILYNTGVRKFRLTGGEPTIRREGEKNIIDLVRDLTTKYPEIDLAITTNGVLMPKMAGELKDAGLQRVNISLDILDEEKFNNITRRNNYDKVIAGISSALEAGFKSVKINAVAIKGLNTVDEELEKFIDFAHEHNTEIRFIEIMPFTGNNWSMDKFISSKEIRERIEKKYTLELIPLKDKSQTSRMWKVENKQGRIGFISSVSESFCRDCDRIRITAEGNLRPCLHEHKEYPLKHLIRNNKTDQQILEAVRSGLNQKWKEHPDFLSSQYLPPDDDRIMLKIGG